MHLPGRLHAPPILRLLAWHALPSVIILSQLPFLIPLLQVRSGGAGEAVAAQLGSVAGRCESEGGLNVFV